MCLKRPQNFRKHPFYGIFGLFWPHGDEVDTGECRQGHCEMTKVDNCSFQRAKTGGVCLLHCHSCFAPNGKHQFHGFFGWFYLMFQFFPVSACRQVKNSTLSGLQVAFYVHFHSHFRMKMHHFISKSEWKWGPKSLFLWLKKAWWKVTCSFRSAQK